MEQGVAQLNPYEIKFYFLTWIGSVLYSLYQFYLAGDHIYKHQGLQGLTEGWKWLGRKRDNSDYEWNIWIPFIKNLLPWIFVQLIISQYLKHMKIHKTVIYSWYIIVTGAFLWNFCGINAILFLMISPCIACLLISLRSKLLVYIVHLVILLAFQYSSTITDLFRFIVGDDLIVIYMMFLAIFWLQLKTINYSIDNINNYKHRSLLEFLENVIQCTAYCWYLPTFFFGPHIVYHKFINGMDESIKKWTIHRTFVQLFNLLRLTFWIFLSELMLHFLYSVSLTHHPHIVEKLNPWAFYGMGYCMGQYFCNKYIVVHGICGEFGRMDDIDVAPKAKCIGRVHLYSEMWKYFDRGLYEFLVRCIYVPVSSLNIPLKKFVASLVTFSFIYIWHGVHKFILIWTVLNFMGVSIESIARSIGNSPAYVELQQKFLSPRNIRRFHCILATPLLAMSAASNFYFLAGSESIGHLYIYKLFHDTPIVLMTLMFLLYCACQVATEIKLIEKKRELKAQNTGSIEKKLL